MSDLIGGLDKSYAPNALANDKTGTEIKTTNKKAGLGSLDMTDFLQLIVQQFQNQTPDNMASTSDMMNQMVQMSVVQAITNITDAATMLYTSSLVGKEVTIGQFNETTGKLDEIVGTVEGTGTYSGQPVIFVDGKTYSLSDIMAVGKLPPKQEAEKPDEGGDGKDDETSSNDKV